MLQPEAVAKVLIADAENAQKGNRPQKLIHKENPYAG